MSTTLAEAHAPAGQSAAEELLERYRNVRAFSARMCEGMEPEDFVIQSMPDVSPTKWHLAHTTWFFEAFLLEPSGIGYEPLNAEYSYLFNSYYNAIGQQFCRPRRGQISRPTVREVMEYRRHVDEAVIGLIERFAREEVLPELRATAPEAAIETTCLAKVPGLAEQPDSPAEALVRLLTGSNSDAKVSFATEAGLFQQAGVPTVICGPGSIRQAHQPDEFIEISQLAAGEAFMEKLVARLAA